MRKLPLKRYYTLNRAAKLLNISPTALFHKLTVSPYRHALFINKDVLVHPDAVTDFLRKKGQTYIRRAIKEGKEMLKEGKEMLIKNNLKKDAA